MRVRSVAGEGLGQGAGSIRTVARLDALVPAEADTIRRSRPPSRRASNPYQASSTQGGRIPEGMWPTEGDGMRCVRSRAKGWRTSRNDHWLRELQKPLVRGKCQELG